MLLKVHPSNDLFSFTDVYIYSTTTALLRMENYILKGFSNVGVFVKRIIFFSIAY